MRVLILGSGQLARMMCLAGCPLGIQVQSVDVNTDAVVDPISKEVLPVGLDDAIAEADAITVEFEHIPLALLEKCHSSGKLIPSIESILAGADRVREKALLERLSVPNCDHQVITDVDELSHVIAQLGEQLVIKASRDGYDGYGQWRLQSRHDLDTLQKSLAHLDLNKVPLVVEKMLQFDRELSLLGCRDKNGHTVFYPLSQNAHHQGQLHVSIAPAPNTSVQVQKEAEKIFTQIAEALEYVGVLAIEFFQVGNQLLVNEIAPRVHNSGHWSMQGADTCQFENHLRAVTDLPLGDTRVIAKSAMINIIGVSSFSRDMLSIKGCHLHWYGKTVRQKRKMGHFNLTGHDYKDLADSMQALSKYLPEDYFPILQSETDCLRNIAANSSLNC